MFLCFPKEKIQIFSFSFQSNQLVFVFMEPELCRQDSGIAKLALFGWLLQKQRDKEGQGGRGRGFCVSWSRGRDWGHPEWVSRLVDKGVPNWFIYIEPGRGFTTCIKRPIIGVIMDVFLAGVALKSHLFATEDTSRQPVTACCRIWILSNRNTSSYQGFRWIKVMWWKPCLHVW